MPLPRPRFRLSTLFWLIFGIACWCGGMRFERHLEERCLNAAWDEAVETGVVSREVWDAIISGERSVLTIDSEPAAADHPSNP
jgi:hypothetical protein